MTSHAQIPEPPRPPQPPRPPHWTPPPMPTHPAYVPVVIEGDRDECPGEHYSAELIPGGADAGAWAEVLNRHYDDGRALVHAVPQHHGTLCIFAHAEHRR